ncbi:hypothetical protein PLESTB_000849900 [Pleodorina starrii]|uniref:Uncharacterized protein n=1 Tax=Pleodorina starrii TaxID=330485 RepID=A0A9W6BL70_9CHLO|nr:hypothetical protein PLESTM_001443400 [Pleodorina starrii]GLC54311.1 hypothetical protein PLESTB_000849900 [Pleodorina starrii]GLC71962.1 hypothetical protein PLESTF_001189500 [Pleodorina starrii]
MAQILVRVKAGSLELSLRREDLLRLMPGEWINDEVINTAAIIIQRRLRGQGEAAARCILTTVFYATSSTSSSGTGTT